MIEFVKTTKKNLQKLEEPAMTYAVAQSRNTLDIDAIAQHMVAHGCHYDEGDIIAVSKKLVGCVRELLLEGYTLNLGDLGIFGIRLQSEPVCESVADEDTGKKPIFTADNIRAVRVFWKRSPKFVNLIQNATFHETITLKAKAEAIKVKKQQLADGTYMKKDETPDEEVHE